MSRRAYLLVSAVIFSLVALLHLARIVFGWSAVIGNCSVPMWLSWVGLIVAGALVYFGFLPDSLLERALSAESRRTDSAIAGHGA
jgi:hypothetical protein